MTEDRKQEYLNIGGVEFNIMQINTFHDINRTDIYTTREVLYINRETNTIHRDYQCLGLVLDDELFIEYLTSKVEEHKKEIEEHIQNEIGYTLSVLGDHTRKKPIM